MRGYMIFFFKLGKITVVIKTTVLGDFLYAFFSINKQMSGSLQPITIKIINRRQSHDCRGFAMCHPLKPLHVLYRHNMVVLQYTLYKIRAAVSSSRGTQSRKQRIRSVQGFSHRDKKNSAHPDNRKNELIQSSFSVFLFKVNIHNPLRYLLDSFKTSTANFIMPSGFISPPPC